MIEVAAMAAPTPNACMENLHQTCDISSNSRLCVDILRVATYMSLVGMVKPIVAAKKTRTNHICTGLTFAFHWVIAYVYISKNNTVPNYNHNGSHYSSSVI
jgi:hypothetical protein